MEMPLGSLAAQISALRLLREDGAPFQMLTLRFKKCSYLPGRLVDKNAMEDPRERKTHQLFHARAFSLGLSDTKRVQHSMWILLV